MGVLLESADDNARLLLRLGNHRRAEHLVRQIFSEGDDVRKRDFGIELYAFGRVYDGNGLHMAGRRCHRRSDILSGSAAGESGNGCTDNNGS